MASQNIFAALAQPVRSVADYQADYDSQDLRKLQLVGAQRQNELAALTQRQQMEASQQNALERAARLKAAQDAGGDESAYARSLRLSGFPGNLDAADKVDKAIGERQKAASELGKTKSENAKRDTETENAVVMQWRDMIGNSVNPQQAAQMVAAMHSDPRIANTPIARVPLEQGLQMLQQTPFDQWKQQFALGAQKFVEMNKPTFVQRDSGGVVETLQQPGMGGAPTVVSSAKKTMTPGEIANNGLGYARLKQERTLADGKVTYQTDGNGNLVALPERVAPGTMVRGQAVVGADGMNPIPGKDAGLNDSQSKSYLFGDRMQAANKIIEDMSAKGVNRGGNINAAAGSMPWVGGAADTLTNWTQSPEQQQVKQAKLDFMTAALRRESGASIAPSEFETFDKAYFPQPNDDKMTIANKAALRQRAINGVLVEVPQNKRPGAKAAPAAVAPGSVLKFDANGNLVQ